MKIVDSKVFDWWDSCCHLPLLQCPSSAWQEQPGKYSKGHNSLHNHRFKNHWHLLSVTGTCQYTFQRHHQSISSCFLCSHVQCFVEIYVMMVYPQGRTSQKRSGLLLLCKFPYTEEQLFTSFIGGKSFGRGSISSIILLSEVFQGTNLIYSLCFVQKWVCVL